MKQSLALVLLILFGVTQVSAHTAHVPCPFSNPESKEKKAAEKRVSDMLRQPAAQGGVNPGAVDSDDDQDEN